jgi:glyoxylase-like metal-dependent hydrolase (beta-lactamase superfamily II)
MDDTPSDQAAGVYHRRVGDLVVTALLDGLFQASFGLLTGIAEADAAALQRRDFRADPPRLTVNAFLIRGGSAGPVLVDTGAAGAMGPTLGRLQRGLAAAGVEPASIRTVLLTHLHGDHCSGLLDADGAQAFPAAELVLHQAELDFWTEANAARAPDGAKPAFAQAQATIAPYRAAGRVRGVTGGEAVPGVSIIHLPGHTPGHSGWTVGSGGDALLIWGDVVHMPGVQFAEPGAGVIFDTDGEQAAATRRRTLDMAAADRLLIAGMHLEFPAFGHVARDGQSYRWVPETWDGGL